MRNMSFIMTTQAFRSRSKTVTRRLGWWFLKPGDIVMGVEKSQGLKKGEKVVRLGPIRIVSTRKEQLCDIMLEGFEGTRKEGFPGMEPSYFVGMFYNHNKRKCRAHGVRTLVNRIEFEYLEENEWPH